MIDPNTGLLRAPPQRRLSERTHYQSGLPIETPGLYNLRRSQRGGYQLVKLPLGDAQYPGVGPSYPDIANSLELQRALESITDAPVNFAPVWADRDAGMQGWADQDVVPVRPGEPTVDSARVHPPGWSHAGRIIRQGGWPVPIPPVTNPIPPVTNPYQPAEPPDHLSRWLAASEAQARWQRQEIGSAEPGAVGAFTVQGVQPGDWSQRYPSSPEVGNMRSARSPDPFFGRQNLMRWGATGAADADPASQRQLSLAGLPVGTPAARREAGAITEYLRPAVASAPLTEAARARVSRALVGRDAEEAEMAGGYAASDDTVYVGIYEPDEQDAKRLVETVVHEGAHQHEFLNNAISTPNPRFMNYGPGGLQGYPAGPGALSGVHEQTTTESRPWHERIVRPEWVESFTADGGRWVLDLLDEFKNDSTAVIGGNTASTIIKEFLRNFINGKDAEGGDSDGKENFAEQYASLASLAYVLNPQNPMSVIPPQLRPFYEGYLRPDPGSAPPGFRPDIEAGLGRADPYRSQPLRGRLGEEYLTAIPPPTSPLAWWSQDRQVSRELLRAEAAKSPAMATSAASIQRFPITSPVTPLGQR